MTSKRPAHQLSDVEDDDDTTVKKSKLNDSVSSPINNDNRTIVTSPKPLTRINTADGSSIGTKPSCPYGVACYRQNPQHFLEYSHPSTHSRLLTSSSSSTIQLKRYDPIDKIKHSLPYRFFLTTVKGIPDENNALNALSLKEILSTQHGQLIQSAQFNYMFHIDWLIEQYPSEFRQKPLLIVHGCKRDELASLKAECSPYPKIELCSADMPIPFGTHHTKMMFLLYTEGIRIVIHTSNLIPQDWNQKTQGIWISPIFPKISKTTDDYSTTTANSDSHTNFKRDLLTYLDRYSSKQLQFWMQTILEHDMSSANVHVISSVPGRFTGGDFQKFGHLKLRQTLKTYLGIDKQEQYQSWPIVGQFSSIGSLGKDADQWLEKEFLTTLKQLNSSYLEKPELKLIYPSVENVRTSLEGYKAGGSLPYSMNTAMRQPWLNKYLYQWHSDYRNRTHASPHIKTYLRTSNDYKQLLWFLVTSANLSKAAWGSLEKDNTQLFIRSYEIGVLFLPKNFSCSSFPILDDKISDSFPIPYDLPPTKYEAKDKPWIVDIPYTSQRDSHDCTWNPH